MAPAANNLDKRQILAAIATQIGQGEIAFPTSTQLALRVRKALDDPDCAVDTVARLIQADPLLAARIVALANSALFGRGGRVITDVPAAVTRVGFSVVRSLATALVTRQIAGAPNLPAHRDMAAALWEHTAHMAALAYVLARRVTRQNPDTALFAGLVHEVGGFYLISRAGDFPGLLEGGLMWEWTDEGDDEDDAAGGQGGAGKRSFESQIGHAILEALSVPAPVIEAIDTLWHGYLSLPPETLGDTLLLANQLAPVKSPFDLKVDGAAQGATANLDMAVGNETLTEILKEATSDVRALAAVLRS
jgi:HD-like signal output (HDOD) protein